MKLSQYQFIDANIIMYAIGSPHALRESCIATLKKIKNGAIQVVANTEVLQEILYRFYSIKRFTQAEAAYHSTIEICKEILPVTRHDMDLALELMKKYTSITSRDAVHAATMINHEIKDIISVDPHFDLISDVRRIPPA